MLDDLKRLIQNADPEDGEEILVRPSDLKLLTKDDLKPDVSLRIETGDGSEPIPGVKLTIYRPTDADRLCIDLHRPEYRKVWFLDVSLNVYARAFEKALTEFGLTLSENNDEDDTWVHLCYVIETSDLSPLEAYEHALGVNRNVEARTRELLQPVVDAIEAAGFSSQSNCL